ncbi:EF-hand calcium-binding domain-containing protein 1 [Borealophlyctis nickersoniae]|nr:EF-hand calcium-binding domain-containing protein 1 [Borealophlyctis nickersoniae]
MGTRAAGDDLYKGTNFTRPELETLTRRFLELALTPNASSTTTPLTTATPSSGPSQVPSTAPGLGTIPGSVPVGVAVVGGAAGAGVGEVVGRIDRSRFRDLLADTFGVDDSLIMDRVFRCFDLDADNYISFDEFVRGMSVFLKGRPEEKMKFCFRVYDLNADRYISKEEMYQMLKNSLVKGSEEDEDGVKDLVDLVLKKLDEDRDGRVSEGDWNGAIGKEALLMEAFGQCLPRWSVSVHDASAFHVRLSVLSFSLLM